MKVSLQALGNVYALGADADDADDDTADTDDAELLVDEMTRDTLIDSVDCL